MLKKKIPYRVKAGTQRGGLGKGPQRKGAKIMSMPITNIAFVFRKEDKEKILNKIQEWDRGVDKEAERKSHPYFQTAMDIYRDAGKVENDHYFLLCWKGVL